MEFGNLIATEPKDAFEPMCVALLERVQVGARNDFRWTETEEGIAGRYSEQTVHRFLLASRHQGLSVGSETDLPLDVYVCCVKDSSLLARRNLDENDVSILCWALLLAPEDERTEIGDIYESIKQVRGNVNHINPVHR